MKKNIVKLIFPFVTISSKEFAKMMSLGFNNCDENYSYEVMISKKTPTIEQIKAGDVVIIWVEDFNIHYSKLQQVVDQNPNLLVVVLFKSRESREKAVNLGAKILLYSGAAVFDIPETHKYLVDNYLDLSIEGKRRLAGLNYPKKTYN
jgi:hypothetical protein